MIPDVLMLAGALVWLAGEIFGVVRDAAGHKGTPDTTSGWVWLAEKKWPAARMVVAVGLAVLAVHFLAH